MPALDDILQQKMEVLESKHQHRVLCVTDRQDGVVVMRGGKSLISFSCNDYLGLSHHPKVIAAAKTALEQYGTGAGASRLVTGNHPLYDELEAALAAYKGTEAACIFGSGYLANLGTMPALVGKGDLILADKFVHACMIDAARLSGATVMRFAHNNFEHCRMLLEANRIEHQNCLILTETVFSMDGDRAPIRGLKTLVNASDSWLMTDDAHGLGVLSSPSPLVGEGGEGGLSPTSHTRKDSPLPNPPPQGGRGLIEMGTLSKATGSYGGYVCGSKTLVEYLKTAARTLIYSTALPPANIAASLAAIQIMQSEPELVAKPLQHAKYFTQLVGLPEAQSAIVPVILKDNDKVLAASALLEEKGFLVAAIRPPTVPENTARLRFAFSALHTREQIEAVADIIKAQGWL